MGILPGQGRVDLGPVDRGAPDQAGVAGVRDAPVRREERDAKHASDQDLTAEHSIELPSPRRCDRLLEVSGPQTVGKDRLGDEVGVEGDGLLRLGDRVLADEGQDPDGRDREADGGVDREAKNEPGRFGRRCALGADVRQRRDVGCRRAQRRVRQVLPQMYQ